MAWSSSDPKEDASVNKSEMKEAVSEESIEEKPSNGFYPILDTKSVILDDSMINQVFF